MNHWRTLLRTTKSAGWLLAMLVLFAVLKGAYCAPSAAADGGEVRSPSDAPPPAQAAKTQGEIFSVVLDPRDPAANKYPLFRIAKVQAGNRIVTLDPVTAAKILRTVTRISQRTAHELVKAELADPGTGAVVEVKNTPDHPFFTASGKVEMGSLGVGTKVVTRAGPALVVRSVTRMRRPEGVPITDFEVADDADVSEAQGSKPDSFAWLLPGSLPAEEERAVLRSLSSLDAGTRPAEIQPIGWGRSFRNYEGNLPGVRRAGGYREYDVPPPPGMRHRGPRRLVAHETDGSVFYTWTHYGDNGSPAFVRIR